MTHRPQAHVSADSLAESDEGNTDNSCDLVHGVSIVTFFVLSAYVQHLLNLENGT